MMMVVKVENLCFNFIMTIMLSHTIKSETKKIKFQLLLGLI